MPEITQGPWQAEWSTRQEVGQEKGWHVFSDDAADGEATICEISDGNDRRAGNARLIAAAPDLLEACTAIANRLEYLQGLWGAEGVTHSLAMQVRGAIAKATSAD